MSINKKEMKIFLVFILLALFYPAVCFCQAQDELDISIDLTKPTIALPKIFKPYIDLSGRGFHKDQNIPQSIADKAVLERWNKEVGFKGVYRIQYNLWDINKLSKDKEAQEKLLNNYEGLIKEITDAGGIVILNLFGTPAGMGRVLDKTSAPVNLKAYKILVKDIIRKLSCEKRYNVWYEAWNAPDLDDFFLGRKQDYLNLYRMIAEAVKELKSETNIYIPVGGPSISWWFQSIDGNNITTPEKSLIYELIRFCYKYQLPLDFISWHAYSTDQKTEKESTIYKKTPVGLIRDWLSYFNFDRNIPLIIDEWNYDRSANILPERSSHSFVSASYIPARLKNMYESGLNYQVYFCLEDFQNNKEWITRNIGAFSFDPEHSQYKGYPKASYTALKMIGELQGDMVNIPLEDEFISVIATKSREKIVLIISNYIDPDILVNYISRNISSFKPAERRTLVNIMKSESLKQLNDNNLDIIRLRASGRIKSALKKAQELNNIANKFSTQPRTVRLNIKFAKEKYSYRKYVIDSSWQANSEFSPKEDKQIGDVDSYAENLSINPYSVTMIVLEKNSKEKPTE